MFLPDLKAVEFIWQREDTGRELEKALMEMVETRRAYGETEGGYYREAQSIRRTECGYKSSAGGAEVAEGHGLEMSRQFRQVS